MTVCEAPNDRGASWTDNDTIVLAPHIFGGLLRVHAAGGVPEPLTSLAEGEASHAWPQVIAGRQAVLFTGGPADAPNVQVLSLSTRETKVVIPAGYCGRYVPSGHVIYVHRNTLFAVRFDIDTLETRGVPVPIVDDVADDVTDRTAHFDFANDGTLVYLSRDAVTSDRTIAWMDKSGQVEKLLEAPGTLCVSLSFTGWTEARVCIGTGYLGARLETRPAIPRVLQHSWEPMAGMGARQCAPGVQRAEPERQRPLALVASRGWCRRAADCSWKAPMNCIHHQSRQMAHTWQSIGAARKLSTTSGCYLSTALIRSARRQGHSRCFCALR